MSRMMISQNTRSRTVLILALLLCLGAAPYAQQGTVAPVAKQQFLDNNGNPLSGGLLYTYAAGTTTPLSTYTNVGLSVANPNPIVLDSAGRATIFLTSASYKFILADSADVVIWSQDNISSVAPFNVDLDVTGTAGETLAAGDLVYLCAGTGCATAGRWYKTDADLVYASTGASQIGMATAAITSGAAGSLRLAGRVTGLSGLSIGLDYYASATAGALAFTPPTNAVRVGRADSSTSLVLGNFEAPVAPRGPPCGRLTLTTGVPVTVSDVTAATTLYYAPYAGCNQISLFDGSAWGSVAFAQLSIAVPATTSQMYDVFAYDNAGVVALELTAWTNDTTRATALTQQNGVYVKNGVTTRLYLGSFRTTGVSGQTESSCAKQYVWNYYNRVPRCLRVTEAANSWTYDNGTFQQANANTANQVDVVVGVAEVLIDLTVFGAAAHSAGGTSAAVAVGEDVVNAAAAGTLMQRPTIGVSGTIYSFSATLKKYPAVGRHFYAWIESGGGATTTFYGDNNTPTSFQSGLTGFIDG